ncbi:hypothetical protein F5Y18DRAFT_225776 [Xylariaceae sp. FL1019]|nr:hypothetical protein F5Y18DRAFT_225776 [Xylariaceae sp. FL1019]
MMRSASSTMSFFSAVTILTWLFSVSDRAANSYARSTATSVHAMLIRVRSATDLCLSAVAVMGGDAYLVKQAMELADNGVDLLGEVTRVHVERVYMCLCLVQAVQAGGRVGGVMVYRLCTEDRHAAAFTWKASDRLRERGCVLF